MGSQLLPTCGFAHDPGIYLVARILLEFAHHHPAGRKRGYCLYGKRTLERHQHEGFKDSRTEASYKKMSLAKGKETSSSMSKIAKDGAEPANLTKSTIRMLKAKCGLSSGSTHTVAGETPSKLHWLLEDGKHHVNKDKEDDHWEWVTRGVIPVGEKRKLGILKGAGSDQLKQLELLAGATQLGTWWMVLQRRNPRAYRNMLSQLAELESSKAQEEEDNPVQQTTGNCGTADLCGSAVRNHTAVEAGSVGVSRATAAQVSQKEQGTQISEAAQLSVWSHLGTTQADGSGGASRAAAAQASESVKMPCFFAAAQHCRGVTLLGEDS